MIILFNKILLKTFGLCLEGIYKEVVWMIVEWSVNAIKRIRGVSERAREGLIWNLRSVQSLNRADPRMQLADGPVQKLAPILLGFITEIWGHCEPP